jgi:hypothetical protein
MANVTINGLRQPMQGQVATPATIDGQTSPLLIKREARTTTTAICNLSRRAALIAILLLTSAAPVMADALHDSISESIARKLQQDTENDARYKQWFASLPPRLQELEQALQQGYDNYTRRTGRVLQYSPRLVQMIAEKIGVSSRQEFEFVQRRMMVITESRNRQQAQADMIDKTLRDECETFSRLGMPLPDCDD